MDDQLRNIIFKKYNIDVQNTSSIEGGYLTNNIEILSFGKRFFLKQQRTDTASNIGFIEDIEDTLFQAGIPVILPYKTIDDKKHFIFNDQIYTLYPYINGHKISFDNLEKMHIEAMGDLLSKIHLATKIEDTKILGNNIREGWDTGKSKLKLQKIYELIDIKKNKTIFDINAKSNIQKKISFLESNTLKLDDLNIKNNCILHGDYWQENVFFAKNGKVQNVFDFEKSVIGADCIELIRSMFIICFNSRYNTNNFEKSTRFLNSYLSMNPINKTNIKNSIHAYIMRIFHSNWIESEHYIEKNYRLDSLYVNSIQNVNFFSEETDYFIDKIINKL
ncbi:phosphotransferase [Siphonobacter sp. SORGH_AS_0500]|uniref:phosphotransferase n=1 Tax=Siphonobacter sp. SORGH_AS_0500 TaxID=1864824 RepID=UPI002862C580|nr:phosphotransferase [Siphonobacter sp. SORGH_AS_0500]MDR6193339.1 Ser/Thr protein kinase RdoA (MazF antagonist) [Siphonobacter sp. SORGH_AS_0500]